MFGVPSILTGIGRPIIWFLEIYDGVREMVFIADKFPPFFILSAKGNTQNSPFDPLGNIGLEN